MRQNEKRKKKKKKIFRECAVGELGHFEKRTFLLAQ